MRTLGSYQDVSWARVPNQLTVRVFEGVAQSLGAYTAAGVIVVDSDERVLLTYVDQRGWDLPLGHIEEGETARAGATRELAKETGLAVDEVLLVPVGELVLEVGGAKPAGYRYPFPESAILVFGIRLEGLGPQTAPRVGSECSEARFVDAEVLEYLVGQKQWLALVSVVMDE